MLGRSLCVLLAFVLFSCSDQNEQKNKPEGGSHSDTISILFAGDLLLDRGVRDRIEHVGIESLFDSSVDSLFDLQDLVIANLECPATEIKEPINKQFIFRAEPRWLSVLKNHGITHLNLANNHSMDQGRNGLTDTWGNVVEFGLHPLGYGKNSDQACKPVLLAESPKKVYLISSLRVPSENWTYLPDQPCVCEASINEIISAISELKKQDSSSVVLVQLHWGIEHVSEPTTGQKQAAHQMIDAGADLIVGHHPHTIQTIEEYRGKMIYYSIGNFIFDQTAPINSEGLLVQIKITSDSCSVSEIKFQIERCVPKLL